MSNKRDLKKAIKRACSSAVGAILDTYEENRANEWGELIVQVALIQQGALSKVMTAFDREPGSFANGREYRKARKAFARSVVKGITDYMRDELGEVAREMNALTPKAEA